MPKQIKTVVQTTLEMLQDEISAGSVGAINVSMESYATGRIGDSDRHSIQAAQDSLNVAIEQIAASLGMAGELTQAQKDSAKMAAVIASNPVGYMRASKTSVDMVPSTESFSVSMSVPGNDTAFADRAFSLEAYSDQDNKNALLYSIVYNLNAARQDEFGETLFPTIAVSPDQVGLDINTRVMSVFEPIARKTSGAITEFRKKNIVRALANSNILKNDLTLATPIYRNSVNTDKFVDSALLVPQNIVIKNEAVKTSALATGVDIDLLGLSQTDTLLANGAMNETDALDPAVRLTSLVLKVGTGQNTDVIVVKTDGLPGAEFNNAIQGNYRLQQMNFQSTSIILNAATKHADGSALAALASIVSNDYVVRLNVGVTGSVNVETGALIVNPIRLSIHSVRNTSGQLVDLTTGAGAALVTLMNAASIVGYNLSAYRSNANLREQGQKVDVTFFTQRYNVPLRSPISAVRPISSNDQADAPYIQSLVATTQLRLANQAVTALLAADGMISSYADLRQNLGTEDDVSDEVETLGIGRFFVKPAYSSESVDAIDVVDSINSSSRAEDFRQAILNKVRDMATKLYRDSELKAGAQVLAGGPAKPPVVIIATDFEIANWLIQTGDVRTLGGVFDCKIVSSIDLRMKGKIFVTFGIFDEDRNSAPHPLNFGNMAWAPELNLVVPAATRGGAISKESIVQPRFTFFVNLPVLGRIDLTGISSVLNKVTVNVSQ